MQKTEELKVFISNRVSTCGECGNELGQNAWIMLAGEQGTLCLSCADMDHLAFLPSGDAALTRRARKYSGLSAVVLKWSRARKRYERQGILVQEAALATAEQECLSDSDAREHRRQRDAERREELDGKYVDEFAISIRKLFPNSPPGVEILIAEHACLKFSGRVGRTAAAKKLDETVLRLAVAAHVRHTLTNYDALLAQGYERFEARKLIADEVELILNAWQK